MNQLALALRLDARARFSTFAAGKNHALLLHLETLASGPGAGLLWIWGGPGSGKSHLLQAACRAADAAGRRAMYLPLDAEIAADPEALADLEGVDLLAIDAIERVAGDERWERRLFVALNDAIDRGSTVLMAARGAPAAAGFGLADLSSRAAAAAVYRLQPLDDEELLAALMEHARARGLELDRSAAQYLLHRVARDMGELVQWLDRLDQASLIAQRKLTIPFIRATIREP